MWMIGHSLPISHGEEITILLIYQAEALELRYEVTQSNRECK